MIAAAELSILPQAGLASEKPKLNSYNWDTYIGETTLADFKALTGTSVRMDLIADNDELFARLKDGKPGYDVNVPANNFVERMTADYMLMPSDHAAIPSMANIEPAFRDAAVDPGWRHSIPHMWGTVGIGYRKFRFDNELDSWRCLYDSDRYSGRCALLSEAGTMLGATFRYMGHPLNTADPKIVGAVEKLIVAQKLHFRLFAPDNGQNLLLPGEMDIAMEWNGDRVRANAENDDIAYVVPHAGSILWEDAFAITRGEPYPENAHAFINFILVAEAGARRSLCGNDRLYDTERRRHGAAAGELHGETRASFRARKRSALPGRGGCATLRGGLGTDSGSLTEGPGPAASRNGGLEIGEPAVSRLRVTGVWPRIAAWTSTTRWAPGRVNASGAGTMIVSGMKDASWTTRSTGSGLQRRQVMGIGALQHASARLVAQVPGNPPHPISTTDDHVDRERTT